MIAYFCHTCESVFNLDTSVDKCLLCDSEFIEELDDSLDEKSIIPNTYFSNPFGLPVPPIDDFVPGEFGDGLSGNANGENHNSYKEAVPETYISPRSFDISQLMTIDSNSIADSQVTPSNEKPNLPTADVSTSCQPSLNSSSIEPEMVHTPETKYSLSLFPSGPNPNESTYVVVNGPSVVPPLTSDEIIQTLQANIASVSQNSNVLTTGSRIKPKIFNVFKKRMTPENFVRHISMKAINFSEREDCLICQRTFKSSDNVIITQCAHKYHSNCLVAWIKTSKVCPVCSSQFRVGSFGNI